MVFKHKPVNEHFKGEFKRGPTAKTIYPDNIKRGLFHGKNNGCGYIAVVTTNMVL
jgi:hypothetical protein